MIVSKKLKQSATLALLLLSTGCTITRATDPDGFKSLAKAQIPTSEVLRFSDCLMDRFQVAHTVAQVNPAQHRRTGGYRIEQYAGTGRTLVVISVDIMDDGHVELFEPDAAALINTKGEREGFDYCTAKVGGTRK